MSAAEISIWVTDYAGNTIKTILTDAEQGIGSYPDNEWDGTDYSDTVVDDGDYTIHLLDDEVVTEPEEMLFNVTVDRTLPTVSVTDPVAGSFIRLKKRIIGTALDTNFLEYNVLYKEDTETEWKSVYAKHTGVESGTLYYWETEELNGNYQLKIFAKDLGENENEVVMDYIIDNTAPYSLIINPADAGVVNNVFTVTAETYDTDISKIRFEIKEDNEIDWTEVGAATEIDTTIPPEGEEVYYSIQLDSANYNHGHYDLRAVAVDTAGNTDPSPQAITFLIDKMPPTSWISEPLADEVVGGTVNITASSNDLDIGEIKISYREASQTEWLDIVTDTTYPYNASLDMITLPGGDGYVYLRSTAKDTGNLTEVAPGSTRIKVDNTLPVVAITLPAESQTIGGTYDITGTVNDTNIASYKAEYREEGATDWTLIDQVTNVNVTDGVLASFNTSLLVHGNYEIKLTAIDRAGNEQTSVVTVLVQNQAPEVTDVVTDIDFVSLSDTSLVKTVDVEYTLTEDAAQTTLEILNNEGVSIRLIEGIDGIAGINTYTYDCMDSVGLYLTDGTYTTKVTAYDQFDNKSFNTTSFTADSAAPIITVTAPASGDDVFDTVNMIGDITESNLDSYSIYYADDSTPTEWTLENTYSELPTLDFLGSINAVNLEGSYTIKVTALDLAGNTAEEALIPVTIHDSSAPIENISLSETFVNATSILDITFGLKRQAGIVINVRDSSGTLMRSIDAGLRPQGSHTVSYNLTIDDNITPLDDGTYTVIILVNDILTTFTTSHNAGMFTLDTVEPVAVISAPDDDEVIYDNKIVTGSVSDETQFKDYTLSHGVGLNPADWTLILSDTAPPSTYALGIFEIAGLDGIYTIKLTASDLAGNSTTDTVVVNVYTGALSIISNITLSPVVISPDADGTKDETTLGYDLNETSRLLVTIVDDTQAVVRTLFDSAGASEDIGAKSHTWDGKDSSDTVVPGTYTIKVKTTDPVTLEEHEYNCGSVIVDITNPQFTITSPADADLVIDTVDVFIDMTEPNFSDYTVEVKETAAGEYTLIDEGSYFTPGMPIASWDTSGISGDYNILVTVNDHGGNTSSQEITVNVIDGSLPLISNVNVSEEVISPNGDGVKDSTNISFTIYREMIITVLIKDPSDNIVRTLVSGETYPADSYFVIFDGILDPSDDDDYTYEIIVDDPLRGDSVTTGGYITIDSTDPLITVTSPDNNSYLSPIFDVTGDITEENPDEFTLSYTKDGVDVVIPISTETSAFTQTVDSGITDGSVLVTLYASDLGGNDTTVARTVNIDSTPPFVAISLVSSGAQFAGPRMTQGQAGSSPVVGGTILLSYTATDTNIMQVSILYTLYSDQTTWTEILLPSSNALDVIYELDTTTLTDGEYLLKITALDFAGNTPETEPTIYIDVDNTPPSVAITSPVQDQIVIGDIDITGTAMDDHLLRYYVKLGQGVDPGVYDAIGSYTNNIDNGILHSWTPLSAEGTYTLKLEAVDVAGNSMSDSVSFTLDTIKPPAPAGFTVTLNEQKQPVLSWSADTVTQDLDVYNIYRNNDLICTTVSAAEINYTDTEDITGTYSYYITALDTSGNESDPTEVVIISVDRTGPSVAITSPNNTDKYGGLVVVRGNATSDDFYEYTLETTEGIADETSVWTHVRTSSIPRVNEVLGFFNSAGYDGIMTLRLTGVDTSENTSETSVEANIDNTPPAQPTGFTAQIVNTNDIQFNWTANIETDLAGYDILLYGNRINSQLITGTSDTYASAPDGEYSFSLVAVDEAGNKSTITAPVVIDLDLNDPSISILTPADGEVVTTADVPLFVSLQLDDYDITIVQFQYKLGTDTEWQNIDPTQFPEIIGTADAPITLGKVGVSLNVSTLDDGIYNLKAIATDKNNRTTDTIWSFDLQVPPASPVISTATCTSGTVTLNWSANSEGDLAGYKVYRDGSLISTIALPDTTADDTPSENGTYVYTISAYDTNGNEGAQSATAEVEVDTQPPVITLTEPETGTPHLNGIISIIGTVTDDNPGTTTIEVLRGTDVIESKNITGAPTSDTLHSFNAASRESDEYTIKVSSSDTFDNNATPVTRTIYIDNDPPAAPTALTATPTTDGKVDLGWSWTDVTEQSPPITYNIYYKESGGANFMKAGTSSDMEYTVIQKLTLDIPYTFTVSASDSLGNESNKSDYAEATPVFEDIPEVPIIYYPVTAAEGVYTTGRQSEDIVVSANHYASVTLIKDGLVFDTISASETMTKSMVYDKVSDHKSAIAPDGSYTVIIKNDYLYRINNKTGYKESIVEVIGYYPRIKYSPDSKKVAYVSDNILKVIDIVSLTEIFAGTDTMPKSSIEWSNDSNYIAAVCTLNGQRDIFIYNTLSEDDPVQYTSDSFSELHLSWSPDNTKIAYDYGYKVYMLDLGDIENPQNLPLTPTLLDSVDGDDPDFSPDGEHVAFGGDVWEDGVYKGYIYVKNITTNVLYSLEIPRYPYYLKWAPHGKELIYSYDPYEGSSAILKAGYDTTTEEFTTTQSITPIGSFSKYQSDRFDDGTIWAIGLDVDKQYAYYKIKPPGRFAFESVPLDEGDNVFTAYATNPMDVQSDPSNPVTLNYDPTIQEEPGTVSDLYVINDRLFMIPNTPVVLNEVMIQASVLNDSYEVQENVVVNMKVRDASGTISEIGEDIVINSLRASEDKTVVFMWTPQMTGAHKVIITVDPYDDINETDETNNALERPVDVNISSLSVGTLLPKDTFGEGEGVDIRLLFTNQGDSSIDFSYVLTVEDEKGGVYETITDTTHSISAQTSYETTISWNTANLLGGEHFVRLKAYDSVGELIAEDSNTFTIQPDTGLLGSITLDNDSYLTGEAVGATLIVRNLSTNSSIHNVTYEFIVNDPNGTEVYTDIQTIPEIFISSGVSNDVSFILPESITGTYEARMNLYHMGVITTVAVEDFTVADAEVTEIPSASGTINALTRKIGEGGNASFSYSITNTGDVVLDTTVNSEEPNCDKKVKAKAELISPSRELLLQTIPIDLYLAPGDDPAEGVVTFTGLSEQLDYYMVLLTVEFDCVRNNDSVLDQTGFEIGDVTPPELTLLSPGTSHYKEDQLEISAHVTDDITGVKKVAANEITSDYELGEYDITVRAIDNDDNDHAKLPDDSNPVMIAVDVHDVARVSINEEAVIPRILVWMNNVYGDGIDDEYDNNLTYDETYSGNLNNAPMYVRLFLKTLLDNNYDFLIVQNTTAFLSELRSGYYNVFVINEKANNDNNFVDDTEKKVALELRELINSGATSLISNYLRYDYDDGGAIIGNVALEDITGTQMVEMDTHQNCTLTVDDCDITTTFTEDTHGHPIVVSPVAANVVGTITHNGGTIPGVMINNYGSGKTVFLAFNLSKSSKHVSDFENVYEQFLTDCLSYLTPETAEQKYAGSTASFALDFDVFVSSQLKFELTLPTGGQNITPYSGGVLSGDMITWENSYIAGDSDSLGLTLTLPQTLGTHDLVADVSFLKDGVYESLTTLTLQLDLTSTHTSVINEAIDMLNALTLPPEEEATRTTVITSLSGIAGTDTTDPATNEQLIAELIDDIDTIMTLSADTADIRLKLDLALKILQGKM
jgi:flagellar hook assembly protein FlgD